MTRAELLRHALTAKTKPRDIAPGVWNRTLKRDYASIAFFFLRRQRAGQRDGWR
jgi:hypothetical protein